MTVVINRFIGENRFLSNFHPCTVVWEGIPYPSSEHAYQASKSTDPVEQRAIQMMPTSALARSAGRDHNLMRHYRPDWDEVKVTVMLGILRQKFHDPVLKSRLLATGDATLVEGNSWNDSYWGVCRGKGQNMLGVLLHIVRYEARKGLLGC